MSYDELLLYRHSATETAAELEAERQELRIETWRTEFRRAAASCDIHTESGIRCLPKMVDVFSEALAEDSETVHNEAFRALLLLARKGQIEAVEWLKKLEDRYVAFRETWQ
jgi:hypothetical protein